MFSGTLSCKNADSTSMDYIMVHNHCTARFCVDEYRLHLFTTYEIEGGIYLLVKHLVKFKFNLTYSTLQYRIVGAQIQCECSRTNGLRVTLHARYMGLSDKEKASIPRGQYSSNSPRSVVIGCEILFKRVYIITLKYKSNFQTSPN